MGFLYIIGIGLKTINDTANTIKDNDNNVKKFSGGLIDQFQTYCKISVIIISW